MEKLQDFGLQFYCFFFVLSSNIVEGKLPQTSSILLSDNRQVQPALNLRRLIPSKEKGRKMRKPL
ncbi:CLUMA_CG016110, isoform A [Clunio marinus]|uniref:CLUMA_CG016110, isoform A n=1 Tax=Clunio marinus TaxID=568069 RepID=A0A1J1ISB3_9DIPT|nr:CLUMA_CG016110, isoform A [Clunio marinus]